MSKKDIISDFSALKGKMTFSEHVCDVHDGAKASVPTKATTRAESEDVQSEPKDVLKVGQSVVLMDSSLRGKIAAIGRTVRIDLEDGLMIEAAYGEFAVTDDTEISSLKHTKVKGSKAGRAGRSGSGRSYPAGATSSCPNASADFFKPAPDGTLTVDLHIEALPGGRNVPKGQQLHFQLDTFRRIIRTNISRKGLKITFIHGLGDGTLKSAIRKELDEVLSLHCTYTVGDPAVTIVTIK